MFYIFKLNYLYLFAVTQVLWRIKIKVSGKYRILYLLGRDDKTTLKLRTRYWNNLFIFTISSTVRLYRIIFFLMRYIFICCNNNTMEHQTILERLYTGNRQVSFKIPCSWRNDNDEVEDWSYKFREKVVTLHDNAFETDL